MSNPGRACCGARPRPAGPARPGRPGGARARPRRPALDLRRSGTSRVTGAALALRARGLGAGRSGRPAAADRRRVHRAATSARCVPGWWPSRSIRPTPRRRSSTSALDCARRPVPRPGSRRRSCSPPRRPGRTRAAIAAPRTSRSCSTPAAPAGAPRARCSRRGRCWPTSTSSAAVDPPLITEQRRRCSCRSRSSTSSGSTPRSGSRCGRGATLVLAERFDPGATVATMGDERVTAVLGRARASSPRGSPTPTSPPGSRRSGSRCPVRRRCPRVVERYARHRRRAVRRVRPDRGGAGGHRQRHRRRSDAPTPGSIGRPLPGVEVRTARRRRGARSTTTTRAASSSGARTCSPGTGRTARAARTTTAGSAPATSRSPTSAAAAARRAQLRPGHRQRLQRLSGRGRGGRSRPHAGRRRGRGHRRSGRATPARRSRAYVVLVPGARPRRRARSATVRPRSLARFKLPRAIEIVAALPHTVTGKIMKWQLDRARLTGPPTVTTRHAGHPDRLPPVRGGRSSVLRRMRAELGFGYERSTSTPSRRYGPSTPTASR